MPESRIIVVGGGIVGLSAAYFLARRGAAVTVIERDTIGSGASYGNAGILALGHAPLPRPGMVRKALRLLLKDTSPLYIRPRPDPELIRWMVGFLRASSRAAFDRSMDLLCRIGWEAGSCIRQLIEAEQIECEFHRRGWLEVCATEAAFEHARRDADILRGHGYTVDELSGDLLRDREPAYGETVLGALHYRDSAFANPGRFMTGLARSATARGAEILTGVEAVELRVDGRRFADVRLDDGRVLEGDVIVLAAGAWTTAMARRIGVRVPMQAGKGYHLNLADVEVRPSTTSVLAETFVAVTPIDGGLRLAGTVELSGVNLRVFRKRLDMLLAGARRYLVGLDRARVESTWCGLRPLTADGLPVQGWAPGVEGVYVATGHAMMGFLLGPLGGRIASEAILDGKPSIDAPELRPDRFR